MLAGDEAKQELFSEVLKTRLISGSPYLVFIDNVNRQNPECYRERGLEVSTSNLCSEITLFTDDNHSFVCVLSSLNLARYDEWREWRGTEWVERAGTEYLLPGRGRGGLRSQSVSYNLDGSCSSVCTEESCPWARHYGLASAVPKEGLTVCVRRRQEAELGSS